MQEQFDDLIIDNSSKKDKQKALLLKAILFIVIVLIVALGFKIISGGSDKPSLPQEPSAELAPMDSTPSQFDLVQAQSVEDIKDDDFALLSERLSSEHNVPVNEPSKPQPSAIAQISAPVSAPVSAAAPSAPAALATTPAASKPAVISNDKIVSLPPQPIAQPAAPKPATQPKPAAQPKPIERSVFDSLDIPQKIQPAPSAAAAKSPAPKAPAAASSGTYIQVYAGKKLDPKSHEIKLLDTLGLQYQIVEGSGLQRVIVGPYSAADKAQALKFVREKVKKDAFFYHKK